METEIDEDLLGLAYTEGYKKGKKDADLPWATKFWATLTILLVGIPLLLGWFILVEWLWRML